MEVGTFCNFSSLESRRRELLPAYDLPYFAYYANRNIAPSPHRDSRPSCNTLFHKFLRTTTQSRNLSSCVTPSAEKQLPSACSQKSDYSTPCQDSSSNTCFYCKQPGKMIKNCPRSGWKASQKPHRFQNHYQ
ncbi:hypothetical protein P9112_003993 [Eukaryota sp. TZLM1-RC]